MFGSERGKALGGNRSNFADPETNRAITVAPDKIERGGIYRLRANMLVRDGLPEEGGESVRGKNTS